MLFDPSMFYIVIAAVALVYSLISFVMQRKIGNYKRIKEFQEKQNALQKELGAAMKAKDETKIAEINKKQTEMMGGFGEIMMLQMKPIIFIFMVFIVLIFALGAIDPNKELHTKLQLYDDGQSTHCDKAAGDGVYSNCLALTGGNYGQWTYTVELDSKDKDLLGSFASMFNGDQSYAKNSSTFLYGDAAAPEWERLSQSGAGFEITTDKQRYVQGETAAISAYAKEQQQKPDAVYANIDNGYKFSFMLPFSIPIINVQKLSDITGWFIFCSFIFALVINPLLPKLVPQLG